MKDTDIEEIARKLHNGELILFVGPGMSAGRDHEPGPSPSHRRRRSTRWLAEQGPGVLS